MHVSMILFISLKQPIIIVFLFLSLSLSLSLSIYIYIYIYIYIAVHRGTLLHPPYSQNLSPSDYHLFGPMKNSLRGKHDSKLEEVKTTVKKGFK